MALEDYRKPPLCFALNVGDAQSGQWSEMSRELADIGSIGDRSQLCTISSIAGLDRTGRPGVMSKIGAQRHVKYVLSEVQ